MKLVDDSFTWNMFSLSFLSQTRDSATVLWVFGAFCLPLIILKGAFEPGNANNPKILLEQNYQSKYYSTTSWVERSYRHLPLQLLYWT
jgi:hypothetical protein